MRRQPGEPINLLFVIDSLTHGGTERQLVQLIENLDRDKVRPHLCTLRASEALYDELELPKLQLEFTSFARPSLVTNIVRLLGFLREHRIHIVQCFFQDPFLLGAILRPFSGVKLVGSFRDLGFWRTDMASRKMQFSYPLFAGFVANSEAVRQSFVEADGLSADRIEVIYNGIDLASIEPRPSELLGDSSPIVGIVANLNRPVKRVQDFILAAALVRKERRNARFVIVGDGHLRPELEKLAESLGLVDALHFAGRLADPTPQIRNFHVGVITSETEGFCNALVEYMAFGLPVVATAVGGNPELIQEGKNGYLVPVADPGALSAAILRCLSDDDARAEMGRQNAEKIRADFRLEAMVEHHQRYYDSLLPERS